jgi:hypothetical protein
LKNRTNGIIIPTALFVAQIVLLLVTILVASITYNFNMSLGSVEATEFRYVSFAAANELISDLNAEITVSNETTSPPLMKDELTYETYTKDNPDRVVVDGRVTERWVEPLDDQGEKVLVVAKTYRQSRGNAQEVKMLARFKTNTLARIYNNSLDGDRDSVDPIYFSDGSDSGAWSQLPNVPRRIYEDDGTLIVEGGDANSIPYISGSPDGSVYVLYAPVIDGWKDKKATLALPRIQGLDLTKLGPLIDFTLTGGLDDVGIVAESVLGLLSPNPTLDIRLGKFALNTIDTGNKKGLTIGDLQPINQVLIEYADEVTIAKGAAMLKYDHDSNEWQTLPPMENLILDDNGKFVSDPGNYYVQGVAGPPAGFEGGMTFPLYRKGQDAIVRYTDADGSSEKINLSDPGLITIPAKGETGTPPPPGPDVLLLSSDQTGAIYVQTGELEPVDFNYLLDIMLGDLDSISAETLTSSIYKYEDGTVTHIRNPPARFYNKSGQIVDEDYYPNSRGPTLGGMVGGEAGEITVVNRPQGPGLVDTVYRYRDGEWEVVPSPPNNHYDSAGNEVKNSGPPDRLEIGMGSDGHLILRVPTDKGSDAVFVETDTEGEYDMLPPVLSGDGTYVKFLSQMSAGKKRDGSDKGAFHVNATYFF